MFEGLLGAQNSGSGGANDPVQLAPCAIRQLAAHEVGHARTGPQLRREHVRRSGWQAMDYPAPPRPVGAQGELDRARAPTPWVWATGTGTRSAAPTPSLRWARDESRPGRASRAGDWRAASTS
ncbi:MAG: hypothetical protein R2862_12340 [Thermoanaerobaculia bacterium]